MNSVPYITSLVHAQIHAPFNNEYFGSVKRAMVMQEEPMLNLNENKPKHFLNLHEYEMY